MNHVHLVGKVCTLPEVSDKSNPKRYGVVGLETLSSFRNPDGNFKSFQFKIFLWQGCYKSFEDTLSVGDMIACKGRLEIQKGEIVIVAEACEVLRPN